MKKEPKEVEFTVTLPTGNDNKSIATLVYHMNDRARIADVITTHEKILNEGSIGSPYRVVVSEPQDDDDLYIKENEKEIRLDCQISPWILRTFDIKINYDDKCYHNHVLARSYTHLYMLLQDSINYLELSEAELERVVAQVKVPYKPVLGYFCEQVDEKYKSSIVEERGLRVLALTDDKKLEQDEYYFDTDANMIYQFVSESEIEDHRDIMLTFEPSKRKSFYEQSGYSIDGNAKLGDTIASQLIQPFT